MYVARVVNRVRAGVISCKTAVSIATRPKTKIILFGRKWCRLNWIFYENGPISSSVFHFDEKLSVIQMSDSHDEVICKQESIIKVQQV